MTEAERQKYDRIYKEATEFAMKEIHLHDRRQRPAGWWLRFKLQRAFRELEKIVEVYPQSWSAMWFAGKIQERLGSPEGYLKWLARAYQANPSQLDVAREASMAAMNLGRNHDAIAYAHRALQIAPADAGLHSNLALAFLLAGKIPQAQESIAQALTVSPHDKISISVAEMIHHFSTSGNAPPNTNPALVRYWSRRKV